jgi:hypothetical protein
MDEKQQQLTKSRLDFFGRPIIFGVLIGIMIKIVSYAAEYFGVGAEYAGLVQQTKYVSGFLLLVFFIALTVHAWKKKRASNS